MVGGAPRVGAVKNILLGTGDKDQSDWVTVLPATVQRRSQTKLPRG